MVVLQTVLDIPRVIVKSIVAMFIFLVNVFVMIVLVFVNIVNGIVVVLVMVMMLGNVNYVIMNVLVTFIRLFAMRR